MCFTEPKPHVSEVLEAMFKLPTEKQQEILRELFRVQYSDCLDGDLEMVMYDILK
jgi:hypothetical protein